MAARDAVGRASRSGRDRSCQTRPVTEKPRLRGVSHQIAFFVAAAAGAVLVALAEPGPARAAAAVYALSLCGMLGASALYHRGTWSAGTGVWLRRLDHAMIFVLVAGTYTPFVVDVLERPLDLVVLGIAWGGALLGIVLSLAWIDAPRWVAAGVYLGLGWTSVIAVPQILERAGGGAVALLALGGALYSVGAVVYGRRRPDPRPEVFGFHEVFHAFVIAAATAHFAAVAIYA